jgi:hypothetical protein
MPSLRENIDWIQLRYITLNIWIPYCQYKSYEPNSMFFSWAGKPTKPLIRLTLLFSNLTFTYQLISQYSSYLTTEWMIGLRSPHEGKNFPLATVSRQALRPFSLLSNGYRRNFSGGKARPGRDVDHSPHLVPRWRTNAKYISSRPQCMLFCSGTAFTLTHPPVCPVIPSILPSLVCPSTHASIRQPIRFTLIQLPPPVTNH